MIIGIDASRANRPHKSGTEWYSFYVIKSLATLDHHNTYWLYVNTPPSSELIAAVKNNSNFTFKFLYWPIYAFWTLGRLSLEMLWRRPDVLFIPAHTLPLFSPRRTVNTIHDIAFVRERNLYQVQQVKTRVAGSHRLINLVVKLVTRGKYGASSVDYLYWSTKFALRRAGKIITVSNFTKQEILDIYPQTLAAKIVPIHNGYNNKLYQVITEPEKINEILKKYDLEPPFFLYVGRLEKKKNTPALIEALAILRENHPELKHKLVLIGDASFGYDEVKYVIEEFNLNTEVIMPGWVAEEDLPYIFNGASAFVFPSKHEGFGIPLLQALACGLPTAAADLPVFREVAGDAVLYFDQNDKRDIATALEKIASDNDLRRQLKAKGLAQVVQFSWDKCAQETLKELENW